MKPLRKRVLVAGLLASIGLAAIAQTPPPAAAASQAAPGPHGERMGRGDPAQRHQRLVEHHARRLADLKAKLKLSPAQEGAWTAFTSAIQPPATPRARPDRAEFEKLTTPERIDRLQALRAQRDEAMRQRGEATKTFYAALTPEQQKLFDAETLRHGPRGPHGEGHDSHRMGHHR